MTTEELEKLGELCKSFINKQCITCKETIYQTDWVIENAYTFIEDICNIVGYKPFDKCPGDGD